jgi:hypothetical protein
LLFAPTQANSEQWQLLQVGVDQAVQRRPVDDDDAETELVLDRIPAATQSAIVYTAGENGTQVLVFERVTDQQPLLVQGAAPSFVVLFFNSEKALIGASGAHGG